MEYTGKYDFCGWASKNDLRCRDGRTIRRNAFKVQDGTKVPLVWNHEHNDPSMILGHAWLENRDEGVFTYGLFNNTQKGQDAKTALEHGDIEAMSIWANDLDQNGGDVMHGTIREVSLVLAGANPGAFVESVMTHGISMDEDDNEGIFYTGDALILEHSIEKKEEEKPMEEETKKSPEEKEDEGESVAEIYNAMTEKQKKVVAIIATEFAKGGSEEKAEKPEKKEEEDNMKHNLFEGSAAAPTTNFLSHDAMKSIFSDAKRSGSLKEAFENAIGADGILSHAMEVPTEGTTTATGTQTYGFNDPDMLFPDYKSLNNPPEWISRDMGWVQKVMAGVHHTPFSRIKSQFANITEDEARAKGYIKGKQKKTEVFSVLKRTTDPQTIYKLQKMDRDDIIDITDFDVVVWIKAEMRVMLNEEIARAILIGDGRLDDAEDKISEQHIRPVVKDVPLFNIKYNVSYTKASDETEEDARAKATIRAAIKARKQYKGSGQPTLFTTEDTLTDMLLLEDKLGHPLYESAQALATKMRVKEIVTVEPMEDYTVDNKNLIGVIVNLADYNVGADKGGEVSLFDDFDIDFNKYTYLIETRISGALTKPFSAITLLDATAAASSSVNGD